MSTEITATTTVQLVELSGLDPDAIRLQEGVFAGESVLHLTPEVRLYLRTTGRHTDLEAVEALLDAFRRLRAEILTSRGVPDICA